MEKIKGAFSKIISFFVLFSFTMILGILVFVDRRNLDWFNYRIMFRNYVFVLGWLLVFGLLFWKRKAIAKLLRLDSGLKVTKRTLLIASVVLFVVQLIVAKAIHFQVGWDVKYMWEMATQFLEGEVSSFYSRYIITNPNNIFIYAYNIFFLWLGEKLSLDGYILFIVFGILCANLSCYLVGITTYRFTGKSIPAYVAYGISVALMGLSPWITVPYTDTLSLWVSVLILDLYVIFRKKEGNLFLKVLILFSLGSVGYFFKPINLFVCLAIVIVEVFHFSKEKWNVKKIGIVFLALVVVAFGTKLVQKGVWKAVDYTPDDRYEKPATYYLMLGNNPQLGGVYNTVDDYYISGFYDIDQKKEESMKLLKERLSDMGVRGYLSLLVRKMDVDFNSGLFGWGKEADFVYELYSTDSSFDHFLRNIYYVGEDSACFSWLDQRNLCFPEDGNYFQVLAVGTQGVWILVLFMCGVYGFYMLKRKESRPGEDVLSVAILGMILYLILFETNARYLISMLPLFFVMAGVGCSGLFRQWIGE